MTTPPGGTLRAVVIDAPWPPEVLSVRQVPVPEPQAGEVLVRVAALGLNRSELHLRRGRPSAPCRRCCRRRADR